jgi:hypothetical protein
MAKDNNKSHHCLPLFSKLKLKLVKEIALLHVKKLSCVFGFRTDIFPSTDNNGDCADRLKFGCAMGFGSIPHMWRICVMFVPFNIYMWSFTVLLHS